MLHFFSSILVFIRDKSEANTIDGKHLEELTSKSLPWQDSRWVPSLASTFVFWMSSSRKPACPWFWLKQELRIEGEQVRYFNIQVSFVAFRSNARVKPQQTPFSDSEERMVAEMSRDCKYITTEGFKLRLFTTFSEKKKTIIKIPMMSLRCTLRHQRVVSSWTHTQSNHNFPHTDDLLIRTAYLDCNLKP